MPKHFTFTVGDQLLTGNVIVLQLTECMIGPDWLHQTIWLITGQGHSHFLSLPLNYCLASPDLLLFAVVLLVFTQNYLLITLLTSAHNSRYLDGRRDTPAHRPLRSQPVRPANSSLEKARAVWIGSMSFSRRTSTMTHQNYHLRFLKSVIMMISQLVCEKQIELLYEFS